MGKGGRGILGLLLIVFGGCTSKAPTAATCQADARAIDPAAPRPNILLIVADDLGYSDIGAFGGEILTPNLDALAAEGRVLTDHHAAATCSPSRAMLISGADHHLVGLGTMAEVENDVQKTKPGYEGYLNDSALSIAELLRDSGYHTYMAGKWHLGLYGDDAHSPKTRGFESSFALLSGASSHFAPVAGKPLSTDGDPYRDNGIAVTLPNDFYSSNVYADRLIKYIQENAADQKPFFAYAAFTAPHWPLQAPPDHIDRYEGQYAEGYAVIQQRRLAKQKQLGIIPADFRANPGLPDSVNTPTWDSLTTDQQAIEARKMEVYAAMVENLDANIGRIIQAIKDALRGAARRRSQLAARAASLFHDRCVGERGQKHQRRVVSVRADVLCEIPGHRAISAGTPPRSTARGISDGSGRRPQPARARKENMRTRNESPPRSPPKRLRPPRTAESCSTTGSERRRSCWIRREGPAADIPDRISWRRAGRSTE